MKILFLCATLLAMVDFRSENPKEQEILYTWQLYFESWGQFNPPHSRTKNLKKYAGYILKWVDHFEKNESSFGGTLPLYEDNHLLVAVMIQLETGLRHRAVGSLGETGLMQVHGKARKGYTAEQVRNDPELSIKLGVQWLAYSSTICDQPKVWDADAWALGVSQYAAGSRAIKNGRCKVIRAARYRIRSLKRARAYVDKKME